MEPVNPNESNVVPSDRVQKRYTDRTLGAISMALGVLTIIIGFVACINWLALIPGALGLGVGIYAVIIARKNGVPAPLATWGIILNVVGLLGVVIINQGMNTTLFGKNPPKP